MVDIRNLTLPLRITENRYIKSSLEDSVHFGSLKGYESIEKQGIGDEYEGKLVGLFKKEKSTITLDIPKVDEKIIMTDKDFTRDPKIEYELKDDVKDKIGVACFEMLTFKDFELYKSVNNKKIFRLKKDTLDDVKRLIQEKEQLTGNDCSLIVFPSRNFFSSIKKAGYEADVIQYYDPYNISLVFKLRDKKKAYCYLKRDYFRYQREYRIIKIAEKEFPKKGENLNIRGISKGAIILSLKQLNSLQFVAEFNN